MNKTILMTLKKRWFDEILSGVKKSEYREKKPFWDKRLIGKKYDRIKFTNGYGNKVPYLVIEFLGISTCFFDGKEAYEIKLGNILEKGNM